MGKFVTKDMIQKARQMDLYGYMAQYEPENLMRVCAGTYRLREHDSVVISNGLWVQKSTGIGGRSALDYLVKVRGLPFQDAVEQLSGLKAVDPQPRRSTAEIRTFKLPPRNASDTRVRSYLAARGLSKTLLDHCIRQGLLFESAIHHNAVFVGYDYQGVPRYAFQRGCGTSYRNEADGSDKRYCFRMGRASGTVHVFEAAIDALSWAELLHLAGRDWEQDTLLSLGGVARRAEVVLPMALKAYLEAVPQTCTVCLHMDNDEKGRLAVEDIKKAMPPQLCCVDVPPVFGKDVNDTLLHVLREPSPADAARDITSSFLSPVGAF